ncbi:odorant receptor 110 [Nasonia vitripennis]|nr:odorant receptor 110 [Nasonia vitripennis]
MKEMNPAKSVDVLSTSFLYFKLIGAWRPLNLPKWLRVIYDLFTISMVILMYEMLIVTEILAIIFAEENRLKVFQDIVHITITHVSGCFKMLFVINRRQSIMLLVNGCVAKQWYPPRNELEATILTKHNNLSRRITLTYATLVGASLLAAVLNPILYSTRVLTIATWYPCNISLPICYWSSYAHQTMGILAMAIAHVATDSLIVGFTIKICTQLNVLNQRLLSINFQLENTSARCQKSQEQSLALEAILVNECIVNYKDILRFADLLSRTFIEIVFIQFCVGLTVICSTVYLLAKLSIFSYDFFGLFLYLGCMLMQMFLFCWYGNEVVLDSTKLFHTIYNINWIELQIQTQSKLLLMMLVASSPIQLFRGAIIKVNLDAFINILKFSYSAFNLLQKSS